MKFLTYSALCVALFVSNSAARHHHHHGREYVATLPDVRPETVSEADIAAHEAARAEAAKVKRNPQKENLDTLRGILEAINRDMSFGVSYAQRKRNN